MKTMKYMQITGLVLATVLSGVAIGMALPPTPPKIGDTAPNFSLHDLKGNSVKLRELTATQPVVLVVLRGWPGYQCPICTRQVQDFLSRAEDFQAARSRVLMVYPGPAERLEEHAREFLRDWKWPEGFEFVIDPGYAFTEAYGLRWEAERETAYPSTFVIDEQNKIRFAKTSETHGGRVDAKTALKALKGLKD